MNKMAIALVVATLSAPVMASGDKLYSGRNGVSAYNAEIESIVANGKLYSGRNGASATTTEINAVVEKTMDNGSKWLRFFKK